MPECTACDFSLSVCVCVRVFILEIEALRWEAANDIYWVVGVVLVCIPRIGRYKWALVIIILFTICTLTSFEMQCQC